MPKEINSVYTIHSFPNAQLAVTVRLSVLLKLRVKLAIACIWLAARLLGGSLDVEVKDD